MNNEAMQAAMIGFIFGVCIGVFLCEVLI